MRTRSAVFFASALLVLAGAGCASAPVYVPPASTPVATTPAVTPKPVLAFPGKLPDAEIVDKNIRITTAKGDIVLKLYPATAPLTVSNFIYLTKLGFYDGLTFHRVIADFMIQGGDPLGNGTGGPGYQFQDEVGAGTPKFDKIGLLAMANAGPGTNGSQFFITTVLTPWLNGKHTIFGEVISGMDVVKAIQQGDKMITVKVEDAK